MRAETTAMRVLFGASLVLVVCVLASFAGAAEKPMGSGTQSQEGIGTPPVKEQPQIQRDVPVPGELSQGQERPMKVPEGFTGLPEEDYYRHLLQKQFKGQADLLEGMREDEAKSSVSF